MPDYNMMGFRPVSPLVATEMDQEAAQQQMAQQQQMAAQQQQMAQQQFPSDVLAIYQGLVDAARGSTEDLEAFVGRNRGDLYSIIEMYPNEPRFNFLKKTLEMFPEPASPQMRRNGGIMSLERY